VKLKNVALGILVCIVTTGANITLRAAPGKDEVKRVSAATAVLNEMMSVRDKAIPAAILEKAEAIAIFPTTGSSAERMPSGRLTARSRIELA
jgi:hypothetical protein